MYRPAANVADEQAARDWVAEAGAMELVSTGPDGYPWATLVPVVWTGDRVLAHLARANEHGRHLDGRPVLLVASPRQAYVTPSWYAAKSEHGRVVPTWNYESVQIRGRAEVFDDPDRLRVVVERLTRMHEELRPEPWSVDDAPATFVAGQLRGIVGVEIVVEEVQAKAKLSQNRSSEDRRTVADGLADGGPQERLVAERMRMRSREGTVADDGVGQVR